MKKWFYLVGLASLFFFSAPVFSAENFWAVHPKLKFQVGYVPHDVLLNLKGPSVVAVPSLKLTPDYLPDITNIRLDDFLSLGFPVASPDHPEQYHFYLKLFKFPAAFDPSKTTIRMLQRFLLDQMKEANFLKAYLSQRENVFVKLGFIAKTDTVFSLKNPYPRFTWDSKNPNNQRIFNLHIPFFSLYIQNTDKVPPLNDADAKAAWTTQAIFHFQQELLAIYQKQLTPMLGKDSATHYYFMDQKSVTYPNHIVVIKMAKQPLIIHDWRQAPMPQNPQHLFLSGLLLTARRVYTLRNPMTRVDQIPPIESEAFDKLYKPLQTQLFELCTVVDS